MTWWSEFADRLEHDVPLAPMTWFRLGGRAKYLFRPSSVRDLAAFMWHAGREGVAVKVLGAGANVLVRDDGFDGAVVRLDKPAFRCVRRCGTELHVGAGAELMPLSRRVSEEGWSGLECMAGIPATVGGAVKMNAGGRFGDFSQAVEAACVLLPDGTVQTWSRERLGFSYRHSHIAENVVLSATLRLEPGKPETVRRRYAECFEYKQRSQPLAGRSAGCTFKNPDQQSAGALIDKAGLKGFAVGGARVSDHHANFILTQQGATASEVLELIDEVRDRVRRAFNTTLELEVEVW